MFATPASGIQAACINCGTTTTPLWRKADDGNNLCNACGLFLKLHGRPRPIALKTDIVKSRNRVKISPMSSLKRKTPYDLPSPPPNSRHADPLSDTTGNTSLAYQTSSKGISTSDVADDPTASAEYFQDVFDPQLTNLEQGENGKDDQKTVGEYDSIISGLRGRVNELELINDLYRGRIVELERKNDIAPETDLEAMLLDETKIRHRISELQRHLEVIQGRDLERVVDM